MEPLVWHGQFEKPADQLQSLCNEEIKKQNKKALTGDTKEKEILFCSWLLCSDVMNPPPKTTL